MVWHRMVEIVEKKFKKKPHKIKTGSLLHKQCEVSPIAILGYWNTEVQL